jgi:hypothetical protein
VRRYLVGASRCRLQRPSLPASRTSCLRLEERLGFLEELCANVCSQLLSLYLSMPHLACRSSKVDSTTYAAAPCAGDVPTSLWFHLPDELRGQPALWLRQRDQTAEHGQAAAPCAGAYPAHTTSLRSTFTRPASPLAKATRPSRRTRANRRAQRRRSPRFDYIRPSDATLASQPFGYGNTTSN